MSSRFRAKAFDVFISYSRADRVWVDSELLPRIEAANLKACVDYRDFQAGAPALPEMERAISNSRKMVAVISPDYVKSQWTEFESIAALAENPLNRRRRLIPILHRPTAGLPPRLKSLIHIDMTGDAGEPQWERLLKELMPRQANPRRSTAYSHRSFFDHLIDSHTTLFAGRGGEIARIHRFLDHAPGGYLFLEGPSGYGKTALLASFVKTRPCAYHFISQAYKAYGSDFDPTQLDSVLRNLLNQLDRGSAGQEQSDRARFQALLRHSPASGSRIIVVDAVDEVDRHPNYLYGVFPGHLPARVYVILSARKLGDHSYLPELGLHPSELADHIELKGLGEDAVRQLLQKAGPRASVLSEDPRFVEELFRVSQGDPFYLRFLVEDVSRGTITAANIDAAPSGLHGYFDLQFSILDRSAYLPQHRDILGVILAAHGPVGRLDLIRLVDDLTPLNFSNTIRDIRRFLLVFQDHYTFCHTRFREYFESKSEIPDPVNAAR
jgi:hypothetical protein